MQPTLQDAIKARLSVKKLQAWSLQALFQLLFWTVLAVCLTVYFEEIGSDISWRELFLSAIAFYWSSALLTPPVVYLTKRFMRIPWWKQGLFHLVAAVAFCIVHPAITVALIDWMPDTRPPFLDFLNEEMVSDLIQYVGIAGFAFFTSYSAEIQSRKIEEASLRVELAQAHAQMLRTQIRPDFLFHTFHEISRLMATDPESARSVMARLSEMLRIALDSDGSEHATLRECLELFECYLDLEKARLGAMFQFDFRAQNEALDAMLPRELLQSVVEGVLDSARSPLLQPAFVNLQAERSADKLRMAVEFGGPGLSNLERWTSTAANAASHSQSAVAGPQVLRWLTLPNRTLRVEMEMPFAAAGII